MKKTKLTLTILFLVLSFGQVFAQGDPIKKLLVDYISAINTMGGPSEKEAVLDLFNDRFIGHTAYVKLSGHISRTTAKKEDLAVQLDEILGANNYKFKFTLKEVLYNSLKERAGTISALVNFQSSIEGKVAEKGTILMNIVGTMVDGKWQIIQNNTVRVSEAKDVGRCVCYVYAKGATKYVTEVYFPAGVEYGQEFEAFRVTSRDGKRIIKSDSNEFAWDKETGELKYKGIVIGTTQDSREAVELALKDLYKESCLEILFN